MNKENCDDWMGRLMHWLCRMGEPKKPDIWRTDLIAGIVAPVTADH